MTADWNNLFAPAASLGKVLNSRFGDAGGFSSFGGGCSKSAGCFMCGGEGHQSRDCPQGGGGGDGKGCFKCDEEGHQSRNCPQAGVSTRGKGCFRCGEEGHQSRDCPQGGGGSRGTGADGEKRPPPYIPPQRSEDEEQLFATIQKGINFDKYDDIPVECTGANPPKRGISSFGESGINGVFKENVHRAKYDKPTPIQKWALPIILDGRDMMACAQTGSGKTAAFLLPVLTGMLRNGVEGSVMSVIQEPQALIIGPTRELVDQIHQEARKFAYNTVIRPVVIYGGVSTGYQMHEVEKGCHLLVATIGRLLDFVRRGKIGLQKIKYLIMDEADRMLDMGFLPDVKTLMTELGMPSKLERQTLMFSATFPVEVQQLAREMLNDYIFVTVGRVGGANTDIEQHVVQVDQASKRDELVRILNAQHARPRTLIFVERKRQADFLAAFLSQSEFPTTSIHGDREQREREEALRDFKSGLAPILVATSVAARGLDIPGVSHVINFDLPVSIDEYVHRIGRTGRCGNLGKATSFFDPNTDAALARPLMKLLSHAMQEIPEWLEEHSSCLGIGGFTGGCQFGARDNRRDKRHIQAQDETSSSLVRGSTALTGADYDEWY